MMSCALCSKWQHILCHNKRDQVAGHPPRNWDSVEFICQRCRTYQLDRSGTHSMLTAKQQALQYSNTLQATALYMIPDTLQPSNSLLRGLQEDSPYDYRPNGVGQSNTRGHFSSSTLSSTSNIYDAPLASTPQIISSNHYQPTEHSFSSSAQKAYRADSHTVNHVAVTSYKPQVLTSNIELHVG